MVISCLAEDRQATLADITFLCKDENMFETLDGTGVQVFHIPYKVYIHGDTKDPGIFKIAGWQSPVFILVGDFSIKEIKYIKTRCKERRE